MEDVIGGLLRKPKDSVVFFAGAGISIPEPSQRPGFEFLSRATIEDLLRDSAPEDLKSKLAANLRPEIVFQTAVRELGPIALRGLVRLEGGAPNANHAFLAEALRTNHVVVTTNLDNLIEDACRVRDIPFNRYVADSEFRSHADEILDRARGRGILLKLHGTIEPDKQIDARYESIQIALDQLGRGLSLGKALVLERLLISFDFCFLGYSGNDDFTVTPILIETESRRRAFWFVWAKDSLGQLVWDRSVYRQDKSSAEDKVLGSSNPSRDLSTLNVNDFLARRQWAFRFTGESSEYMRDVVMSNLGLPSPDQAVPPLPSVDSEYEARTASLPQALRFLIAARLSQSAYFLDAAIAFLEKAEQASDATESTRYVASNLRGEIEIARSSPESYRRAAIIFADASEKAGHRMDHLACLQSLVALTNAHRRLNDLHAADESARRAGEVLDRARQIDGHAASLQEARLLYIRALVEADRREHGEAERLGGRSLQMLKGLGEVSLELAAANAVGLNRVNAGVDQHLSSPSEAQGSIESGRALLKIVQATATKIGERRVRFQACRNLARACIAESEWERDAAVAGQKATEALTYLIEARDSLARINPPLAGEDLEIAFRRAEALELLGRGSEAETLWKEALDGQVQFREWHRSARVAGRAAFLCSADDRKSLYHHAVIVAYQHLSDPGEPNYWNKQHEARHGEARALLVAALDWCTRHGPAADEAAAHELVGWIDGLPAT